ncbi:MAG TPA: hypothetical protein VFH27_10615 [Longimicrobiaceae bacterium]|nr:hypothetical protein [Longimicrobiaceae bacterium]
MSQVVIRQAGPLPIKQSFMWPSSEAIIVAVSGSAWTQKPNTLLTVQVQVDDKVLGTIQTLAGSATVHLALPTGFFAIQRQISQAVLTLSAGADTLTDANDPFTVALIF